MPGFVKSHTSAAAAVETVRRSAALRAAGVPTPAARPVPDAAEVSFDRIDGCTGLALLDHGIADCLRVLSQMHRAAVAGLAPFDPLLRIRPRIGPADEAQVRQVLGEGVPRGTATLHGDLHLGQFIRDAGGGVWMVDLDDMATGPPEADLANLAAHLATSPTGGGARYWEDRVQMEWCGLGQGCDAGLFRRFLRFALVRRHLKLREAGRQDHRAEVAAYLRDSSNFSIL